jgi:hypothetical protein
MSYTYPPDLGYLDALSRAARDLGRELDHEAGQSGADLHLLLTEADAPAEVKAELAEAWGGPGTGTEFLR